MTNCFFLVSEHRGIICFVLFIFVCHCGHMGRHVREERMEQKVIALRGQAVFQYEKEREAGGEKILVRGLSHYISYHSLEA